jgi:hypothetical protein
LESMSFAEEISMVAGNTLKSIKLITSSWRWCKSEFRIRFCLTWNICHGTVLSINNPMFLWNYLSFGKWCMFIWIIWIKSFCLLQPWFSLKPFDMLTLQWTYQVAKPFYICNYVNVINYY